MNILFRLSYWILLLVLVIAYEGKHGSNAKSSKPVSRIKLASSSLEMRGRLRKYFALAAALEDPLKNSICSPMSALLPLVQLTYGAQKLALRELLLAIGLKRPKMITAIYKRFLSNLQNMPSVSLDIATGLFVTDTAKIMKKFKNKAVRVFNSEVDTISMYNQTAAADKINKWVSRQTRGIVPMIIQPENINPDTALVLVNAIHFKGAWLNPFEPAGNHVFYSPAGERTIPMMSQEQYFNYTEDIFLNAQIIEIPYVEKQLAFILVVPNAPEGLPTLLRQLEEIPILFNKALKRMTESSLILKMPKFNIESQLDLESLYNKIGVKTIFKANSFLTKIIKGQSLPISHATQKAVIEVDEYGSKASAASYIGISKSIAPAKVVVVNRPFFFLIRAKKQQLFSGVYNGLQ